VYMIISIAISIRKRLLRKDGLPRAGCKVISEDVKQTSIKSTHEFQDTTKSLQHHRTLMSRRARPKIPSTQAAIARFLLAVFPKPHSEIA
jgi:hypothetical protein